MKPEDVIIPEDALSERFLAATGPGGQLFSISPDGKLIAYTGFDFTDDTWMSAEGRVSFG